MQIAAAENLPVVSAETAPAGQTQGKQNTGFGAMLTSKLSEAMKENGRPREKHSAAGRKAAAGESGDSGGDAGLQTAEAAGLAAGAQITAAALTEAGPAASGGRAQTGAQAVQAAAVPIQEALPEVPETAEQLIGGVKGKLQVSGAEFRRELASQAAQIPAGQVPPAQASAGQIPAAEASATQASAAQASAVQASTAQIPAAQVSGKTEIPAATADDGTARTVPVPGLQTPAAVGADAAPGPAAQAQTEPVPAAGAEAPLSPAAEDTRQTFRIQMKKAQTQASAAPEGEPSGARTEAKPIPAAGAGEASRQAADTAGGDKSGAEGGEVSAGGQKKTVSAHTVSDRAAVTFQAVSASREPQATEDLTELSAAVDRAMERFESDFRGMERDPSSIQIQMEPKELGSITITLASGAGGVAAKIQTDNAQAASLISGQVERMIQAMEAKGVRVGNVDVVYGQMSQQSFSQSGNNANQYGAEHTFRPVVPLFSSSAQPDRLDALSTYESAAGHYAREDGVGQSIEYRV